MTRMQIRDPQTHECLVLTTNPELWTEWDEANDVQEPRHETEHDHNWAELFGVYDE